jgi:hypothetical protein
MTLKTILLESLSVIISLKLFAKNAKINHLPRWKKFSIQYIRPYQTKAKINTLQTMKIGKITLKFFGAFLFLRDASIPLKEPSIVILIY